MHYVKSHTISKILDDLVEIIDGLEQSEQVAVVDTMVFPTRLVEQPKGLWIYSRKLFFNTATLI